MKEVSPMHGLDWTTVQHEFAFDGGWRDIYVLHADINAWQRALDAIRSAGYRAIYFRNDQSMELPGDALQAFPLPSECDRRLSVWFSDVKANCHFFTVEQIEFDIDPQEVKGQEQLDALFDFMHCIANSTGRETILTAENMPNIVIFRVRPDIDQIEYRSFGGFHDWKK